MRLSAQTLGSREEQLTNGVWKGPQQKSSATPWITVAPVHESWQLDSNLTQPFQFDSEIDLRHIPSWLRNETLLQYLSFFDRDTILTDSQFVWIAQYTASVDGEPDPEWEGQTPRGKQDRAKERIHFANLAMWLAYPSSAGYRVVLDLDKTNAKWAVRGSQTRSRLIPLELYKQNSFPMRKLLRAKELYAALVALPTTSNLWPGLRSLWNALTHQTWEVRFLQLWIVLESLFGSEDPQETTFRLAQRTAFFLSTERASAKTLFKQIKSGYHWRSRVVHGMQPNQMRKLTTDKSNELSAEAEELVRRSYVAILLDPTLLATFESPKKREAYLDDLVYSKP